MTVKISKVSDFGTFEIFFYLFTKPFHEFELLPGAAQLYLIFNQRPFFKTHVSTIDKINVSVSIAMIKILGILGLPQLVTWDKL